MDTTLTFGSLFAGIGGFDLGLERAGMRCQWQVEIDPYAQAVLRKHWPSVRRHDDVRTFPPQGEWRVDVICGGFPCQDISVAGKGAGLAGERSGLWYEYARIVGELRPRYVIVENVAALLTRGMDAVLGTLSSLGYDAEWHVVPASAVGAPHRRERVWIVGIRCRDGAEADASCANANGVGPHRAKVNVHGGTELRHKQDGVAGSVREDVPYANNESESDVPQRDEPWRSVSESAGGDVSNAEGVGRRAGRPWGTAGTSEREENETAVADTDEPGLEGWRKPRQGSGERIARSSGDAISSHWLVEPDVGRVAHGVPSRVDRLRCLGNAVVPQIVELIGRAIIEHQRHVAADL